jgi:hypothetical protein
VRQMAKVTRYAGFVITFVISHNIAFASCGDDPHCWPMPSSAMLVLSYTAAVAPDSSISRELPPDSIQTSPS